ncbi:helix-turn-helix domain-containing protein [Patescibacteria group bacterium]
MNITSLEKKIITKDMRGKYDLAFEISEMLIESRIKKGINQEKLAKLIKTKQPSIARAENGKSLPSLSFLEKIANALGTHLIVRFAFLEENKETKNITSESSFKINTVDYSYNSPLNFSIVNKSEKNRSFVSVI